MKTISLKLLLLVFVTSMTSCINLVVDDDVSDPNACGNCGNGGFDTPPPPVGNVAWSDLATSQFTMMSGARYYDAIANAINPFWMFGACGGGVLALERDNYLDARITWGAVAEATTIEIETIQPSGASMLEWKDVYNGTWWECLGCMCGSGKTDETSQGARSSVLDFAGAEQKTDEEGNVFVEIEGVKYVRHTNQEYKDKLDAYVDDIQKRKEQGEFN